MVALLMLCSIVVADGNDDTTEIKGNNDGELDDVEAYNSNPDNGNNLDIETGNMGIITNGLELNQNQEQQRIVATLSNGRNAEVKIMPTQAVQTALTRLRMRMCQNCTIELKEVGNITKTQTEPRLAYEIKSKRNSKLFGLFKTKMDITTIVDAENGTIIQVKKKWWAFLATEPSELDK